MRFPGVAREGKERGAVAIIMAIALVAIFGLAALVVDLGHGRDVRRQAQNAADASALAAGNVLYGKSTTPHFGAAVQAAVEYATQNYGVTTGDWTSCTDPSSLDLTAADLGLTPATTCISFENADDDTLDSIKPDTVRVVMPARRVDTPLGSAEGTSHFSVGALAQATLNLEALPSCAVCVIGPGPHDLQNGGLEVEGGNIGFNGDVSVASNGLVATDGSINVEDSASGPMSSYDPDPKTGQPPIEDPLGFMTMPDITGLTALSDPCSQGEGIYGNVDLNNKTCELSPGLYVVVGTWDMSGNSSTVLKGSGVTLYFMCGTTAAPATCSATGAVGGTLDASGNAQLDIQAPTSGALKGLAMVYDRHNTAQLRVTGEGGAGFVGTVYAPSVHLLLNGNACADAFHSLVVVNTIEMNGNPTCMKSAYAQSENVDLPPDELHLNE